MDTALFDYTIWFFLLAKATQCKRNKINPQNCFERNLSF